MKHIFYQYNQNILSCLSWEDSIFCKCPTFACGQKSGSSWSFPVPSNFKMLRVNIVISFFVHYNIKGKLISLHHSYLVFFFFFSPVICWGCFKLVSQVISAVTRLWASLLRKKFTVIWRSFDQFPCVVYNESAAFGWCFQVYSENKDTFWKLWAKEVLP